MAGGHPKHFTDQCAYLCVHDGFAVQYLRAARHTAGTCNQTQDTGKVSRAGFTMLQDKTTHAIPKRKQARQRRSQTPQVIIRANRACAGGDSCRSTGSKTTAARPTLSIIVHHALSSVKHLPQCAHLQALAKQSLNIDCYACVGKQEASVVWRAQRATPSPTACAQAPQLSYATQSTEATLA